MLLKKSLLCAVTMLSTSACVRVETPESAARVARYDGEGCDAVFGWHDSLSKSDASAEKQVLLATCVQWDGREGGDGRLRYRPKVQVVDMRVAYRELDDRHPNIVEMAISAVNIMAPNRYESKSPQWRGVVRVFGELIDRNALVRAVRAIDLPADAATAFLHLFDDALARANLPDRDSADRYLFDELPRSVVAARKEHFVRFSEMYDELDSIEAKPVNLATSETEIAELRRLRERFLGACADSECDTLPLFTRTTARLASLHLSRGETLDAMAESRARSVAPSLPVAIFRAQLDAIDKMKLTKAAVAIRRDYFELQPSIKPAQIEGIEVDRDQIIIGGDWFTVASLSRSQNGFVTISFGKKPKTIYLSSNCRPTGIVFRNRFGEVEHEEVCDSRADTAMVEEHKPIRVPVAEVSHIKKGDTIQFYGLRPRNDTQLVTFRNGVQQSSQSQVPSGPPEARVIMVKRGERTVQIRQHAVGERP